MACRPCDPVCSFGEIAYSQPCTPQTRPERCRENVRSCPLVLQAVQSEASAAGATACCCGSLNEAVEKDKGRGSISYSRFGFRHTRNNQAATRSVGVEEPLTDPTVNMRGFPPEGSRHTSPTTRAWKLGHVPAWKKKTLRHVGQGHSQ